MARLLRAGSQLLRAGGAAFSPLSLPDLALWLDATKITGVSNGAALTTWNDSSGLGRNAASGVNATYRTGVQNGLPVVRYAAGSHTIAASTAMFNGLHWGGGVLIAVASFGVTADPNAAYALLGNNTGSFIPGYFMLWNDKASEGRNNALSQIVGGTAASANTVNNILPPQTLTIIVDRSDPQNATASQRSRIYVNGGAASANNTQTGAGINQNANQNLQIGHVLGMTGDIAEVIICNSKLSVANINATGAYLAAKWGLTWTAIS